MALFSRRALLSATALAGAATLTLDDDQPAEAVQIGGLPPFRSDVDARLMPWGGIVGERGGPVDPAWRLPGAPVDAEGVVQYRAADGKLYYHPVQMLKCMGAHLASYRRTRNTDNLEVALRHGRRLVAESVSSRGAMWLPYRFAWSVWGQPLPRPWYSGMSQGMGVGVMSQLWMATGDPVWLSHADRLFTSLTLPYAGAGVPWVTGVDASGNLWLDEYPLGDGRITNIINGHTFAGIAVMRYWDAMQQLGRTARAAQARDIVNGALTTLLDNRDRCRVKGNAANYSTIRFSPTPHYHAIHAGLYNDLYVLTGNPAAAMIVDGMLNDFPFHQGAGTVRFHPGSYLAHRFDSAGNVTATRTFSTSRITQAPAERRYSFTANTYGRGKAWLAISAGTLAGWSIQQVPGSVYYIGAGTDAIFWGQRARQVTFAAGVPVVGRAFNDQGAVVRSVSTTFSSGARALSDGRACIEGRQMLRMQDGPLTGLWVPEGRLVRHTGR